MGRNLKRGFGRNRLSSTVDKSGCSPVQLISNSLLNVFHPSMVTLPIILVDLLLEKANDKIPCFKSFFKENFESKSVSLADFSLTWFQVGQASQINS